MQIVLSALAVFLIGSPLLAMVVGAWLKHAAAHQPLQSTVDLTRRA
jgi:hypothetical protein